MTGRSPTPPLAARAPGSGAGALYRIAPQTPPGASATGSRIGSDYLSDSVGPEAVEHAGAA